MKNVHTTKQADHYVSPSLKLYAHVPMGCIYAVKGVGVGTNDPLLVDVHDQVAGGYRVWDT